MKDISLCLCKVLISLLSDIYLWILPGYSRSFGNQTDSLTYTQDITGLLLPVSRLGAHLAVRGGDGGRGLQVSGGLGQGAAARLRGVGALQGARVGCRDTDQTDNLLRTSVTCHHVTSHCSYSDMFIKTPKNRRTSSDREQQNYKSSGAGWIFQSLWSPVLGAHSFLNT